MKEAIRFLMYPIAFVLGGEFYAKEGTLLYRFLFWLYGEPEPVCDGWIYPEDK